MGAVESVDDMMTHPLFTPKYSNKYATLSTFRAAMKLHNVRTRATHAQRIYNILS